MKCPKCKGEMEKVRYDVGFTVPVSSLTCPNCKFNVTDKKILDKAIKEDIAWGFRSKAAKS